MLAVRRTDFNEKDHARTSERFAAWSQSRPLQVPRRGTFWLIEIWLWKFVFDAHAFWYSCHQAAPVIDGLAWCFQLKSSLRPDQPLRGKNQAHDS